MKRLRKVTVLVALLTILFMATAFAQEAIQYKMIQGSYYQQPAGTTLLLSWYTIHNTSWTENLVLGDIYVAKQMGLAGPITKWDDLSQTVIPPLGSLHFNISETGVSPIIGPDPQRGAFMVVVIASGEGILELAGSITSYNSGGDVIGQRRIEPFN